MKTKILITIEHGRIVALAANGNTEVYIDLKTGKGPHRLEAAELTGEQFEGRMQATRFDTSVQTPVTATHHHNAFPKGRY